MRQGDHPSRFVFHALLLLWAQLASAATLEFHVAPGGDDRNAGTAAAPFASIARAQQAVRARPKGAGAIVWLAGGVYRLGSPLEFGPEDGGSPGAPVAYEAADGQTAEISGAQLLNLDWTDSGNGRWAAKVPDGTDFDQLFADGKKMIRARYPNFDPGEGFFGGLSADATDPDRLKRYADPVGMYVHGYQGLGWGSLDFEILEKSPDGRYTFEEGKDPRVAGGWQNKGRGGIGAAPRAPGEKFVEGGAAAVAPLAPDQRFVENVFEELDAPKEWFLDRKKSLLYFIPPAGADPRRMIFEGVVLKNLIHVRGSEAQPVRNLAFRGLLFRRAGYTFMETREIPSGGDWRLYRGGAVVFEGAVDCAVRDCVFDGVGGNAIFVKDYDRGVEITGCEFVRTGASAVLFDGDKGAVRSWWAHDWGWPESEIGPTPVPADPPGARVDMALLPPAALKSPLVDLEPGPKTDDYPARCLVRDCLMHDLGTVEKQISGVFISKAREIVVSHVTIHDVPRAAININDGMWGGDIVEWCDIFNTCLESREHGAINAWGRDRYWVRMSPDTSLEGARDPGKFARSLAMSRLDAVDAFILRYNRVQCANGYDIDLDDGSTNFEIYGNLCLEGGIKLREGYFREVRNNITPLVSTHVWYPDSHDAVTQNIILNAEAYSPRGMKMEAARGGRFDFNLFAAYRVPENLLLLGLDRHSITGDPGFLDPAAGDYRVRDDSPAESVGFVNFPMDRFGVTSPALVSRASHWQGLGKSLGRPSGQAADLRLYRWNGATLRNLTNFGRESAVVGGMELPDNRGVLIKVVATGSAAARAGMPPDAIIVAADGRPVANMDDLDRIARGATPASLRLKILTWRGYIEVDVAAGGKPPVAVQP